MNRFVILLILSFSMFAEGIGFTIIIPVIPDIAERLNLTHSDIGVLYSGYGITAFLLYLAFGYLVDRFGGKWSLAGGLAILAIAAWALGHADSYVDYIVCRMLQGIASAAIWASALPLAARYTAGARRGLEMNVVTLAAYGAGVTSGPIIGGLGQFDVVIPIYSILVAVLFVAIFIVVPNEPEAGEVTTIRDKWWSLGDITASLSSAFLIAFAVYATIATVEAFLPLELSGLGWGQEAIGLLFAMRGVAAIVGQPLVGLWADRLSWRQPAFAGLVGATIFASLLFMFPDSRFIHFLFLGTVLSLMTALGASFVLIAESTHPGREGKTFGLSNTAIGLGIIVGPWIGGMILESANGNALAIALAIFLAGTTMSVWLLLKKADVHAVPLPPL